MTPDHPRTNATLVQLDDGTWFARLHRGGEVLEVAGVTRTEATERLMMIIAEEGDER